MFRVLLRRSVCSTSKLLQQSSTQGVKNVKVISSCPAGTSLNLNIKKSGQEPVALADEEYPEWLWTVLDKEAQASKLADDPMKLRKSQIRKSNRANIKQNNFLKQL